MPIFPREVYFEGQSYQRIHQGYPPVCEKGHNNLQDQFGGFSQLARERGEGCFPDWRNEEGKDDQVNGCRELGQTLGKVCCVQVPPAVVGASA